MSSRKLEIRNLVTGFLELMEHAGFEEIEVEQTSRAFWKELDEGRHVVIRPIFTNSITSDRDKHGRRVSQTVMYSRHWPNWSSRRVQISIYTASGLEGLERGNARAERQEIAHDMDDLVEFLKDEGILCEP